MLTASACYDFIFKLMIVVGVAFVLRVFLVALNLAGMSADGTSSGAGDRASLRRADCLFDLRAWNRREIDAARRTRIPASNSSIEKLMMIAVIAAMRIGPTRRPWGDGSVDARNSPAASRIVPERSSVQR